MTEQNPYRFNVYGNEAMVVKANDGEFVTYEQYKQDTGALQAEVDRLMLEWCPDEMTVEQFENWAKHQQKVVS